MTVGPEDPGPQRRRDVKGSEGRRSFGGPLARAARCSPTAVGGASVELSSLSRRSILTTALSRRSLESTTVVAHDIRQELEGQHGMR